MSFAYSSREDILNRCFKWWGKKQTVLFIKGKKKEPQASQPQLDPLESGGAKNPGKKFPNVLKVRK